MWWQKTSPLLDHNRLTRVLFIDGICQLCDGLAVFVSKRDPDLKILALQSQEAALYLAPFSTDLDFKQCDTVVYLKADHIYLKSDAILELAKDLGGLFRLLLVFKCIPVGIRNKAYDLFARYRYRIFGKTSSCTFK